jgi:BirA family transcriptional regulator, biotin operon repressor / biotin---[acetyl-CoA-carboxylase] ligase
VEFHRRAGLVLIAIRTVAETGSTNADLLALARDGTTEGNWLRALRQTAGRGRQGRNWVSPEGNLYASTLVHLRPTDPPAATLALLSGVALHEAVTAHVPGVTQLALKWPNDLMLGDAKLAGILLERAGEAVVAGIGVNVANAPDLRDRRAASLAGQGGDVDAGQLLQTLAECFERWLKRWRGEGAAAIRAAWSDRAHPPGTPLAFHDAAGGRVEALFDGLTVDGAARLRLADGSVHVMHAGDLFPI